MANNFAKSFGGPVAVAVGKTSIALSAAILARCSVFVGNDSGPAHLAAYVGCPTVVLFGPGNPAKYRPFSSRSVAMKPEGPYDPDGKKTSSRLKSRCNMDHSVEAVARAAEVFIGRGNQSIFSQKGVRAG
jgi:ADP-heptose:LPS heptosyltransferase